MSANKDKAEHIKTAAGQIKAIKELAGQLVEQVENGESPNMDVPVRALSNVSFNEKTRMLELGDRTSNRNFINLNHLRKFLQMLEVAQKCEKELLETGKTTSLRDMFYMCKRTIAGSNINVVDEQTESDKAIEDLELVTGFSREQLHINANKSGSVAGPVTIIDGEDTIEWGKMGSGGWSVPSNVENITFKNVSAKYVIYMEKMAVWDRLNEDKFWKKHNCVIVASQGQTTRGIRRLLQRLHLEHKLPIYVMADFDPWGFYIYSVVKYGSITLAHMAGESAIPGARFLGITADDIENYNIKRELIKFKDVDRSRLKQIAAYDWFKNSKDWQRQFKMMKKMDAKAEIQALSKMGISFITETYLPEKIKNGDYLD